MFVRKATGLVRGWSVRDAFIYAAFAVNLVTLGWYIFAFAPATVPGGGLMWAVIVGGAYLIFQAITYAALIAVMPRAGGDYVWMSRVLGGGIGFVLAVCGWWFILWHWVPIYAYILQYQVLQPLSAIVGWHGGITFWASNDVCSSRRSSWHSGPLCSSRWAFRSRTCSTAAGAWEETRNNSDKLPKCTMRRAEGTVRRPRCTTGGSRRSASTARRSAPEPRDTCRQASGRSTSAESCCCSRC